MALTRRKPQVHLLLLLVLARKLRAPTTLLSVQTAVLINTALRFSEHWVLPAILALQLDTRPKLGTRLRHLVPMLMLVMTALPLATALRAQKLEQRLSEALWLNPFD
ncbi:hypothetical protein OZ13_11685 [Xanthomonas cannabis pv. cannabis]|nr:hypothetical protein OZ13_11685 [Xanthomonas cannabis pv. cannabis]